MRKATGMLPSAGALSGCALTVDRLPSEPAGAFAGMGLAAICSRPASVVAASKLSPTAVLTNALQFKVFVSAFMTRKFSTDRAGSNDNYHHISANDSE
jgi:hypothetical protein